MADLICGMHLGSELLASLTLALDKRSLSLAGGCLLPIEAAAPVGGPTAPASAEPPPPDAEDDGPLPDGHELVPAMRQSARALHLAHTTPVLLSLPKQQGIIRSVLLPSTDEDELAQMAQFETERHIHFHQERHCTGYHVMRSLGVEGSEVLLGAVDGPVIQRALGGLLGAGLQVEGITLSTIGLVNAVLRGRSEWAAGRTVALLNVGLEALDIVLLTDGRVRYARSVSLPLRQVLEQWSGNVTGDGSARTPIDRLAVAARMIDCLDLDAHYAPSSASPGGEAGPAAVRTLIERLLTELRRTYDFARREMKCPPIEAIALSGEGALLRNLPQYMNVNLSIDVQVVNPVASLPGAAQHKFAFDGLEYALALGAALGALPAGTLEGTESLYRLDLVPTEHYRAIARRHTMKRLALTGLLALFAAGLSAGAWSRSQTIRSQAYDDYHSLNRKMSGEVDELQEMSKKLAIINDFVNDPNSALGVLSSVAGSSSIPQRVSLSSFEYIKGEQLQLQGDALQIPDVNAFLNDLRATKHFGENIESSWEPGELYRQPLYRFKLTLPFEAEKPAAKETVEGADEATTDEADATEAAE